MAKKKYVYKDIKLEDIIDYCTANNQVAWLKETAAKEVEVEVYPRKKEIALDENGNPKLTKKGKVKYVSVADKSKKPKKEKQPISFMQLKYEFASKFMPEIMPKKKAAEPTMWDKINAL